MSPENRPEGIFQLLQHFSAKFLMFLLNTHSVLDSLVHTKVAIPSKTILEELKVQREKHESGCVGGLLKQELVSRQSTCGIVHGIPCTHCSWGSGLGRGLLSTTAPCSTVDVGCEVTSIPAPVSPTARRQSLRGHKGPQKAAPNRVMYFVRTGESWEKEGGKSGGDKRSLANRKERSGRGERGSGKTLSCNTS